MEFRNLFSCSRAWLPQLSCQHGDESGLELTFSFVLCSTLILLPEALGPLADEQGQEEKKKIMCIQTCSECVLPQQRQMGPGGGAGRAGGNEGGTWNRGQRNLATS